MTPLSFALIIKLILLSHPLIPDRAAGLNTWA